MSEALLLGSVAVAVDVITLPALGALEVGRMYRVEIKFTAGTNTLECTLMVEGIR